MSPFERSLLCLMFVIKNFFPRAASLYANVKSNAYRLYYLLTSQCELISQLLKVENTVFWGILCWVRNLGTERVIS